MELGCGAGLNGGVKLSARSRRGGVGDAGGLGSNGQLPVAAPVPVRSDAELAAELDAVAAGLTTSTEWVQRVEALLRLEGLLKGGAAEQPTLPDLLMGLRDALATQLQERRSAVSRQACHVVGLLAAACCDRFEPLAMQLLPVLFKTQAMGIQIVSEAADACAHTMLYYCQSARLLPKLYATVTSDRSAKLRHLAAEYVLQVLEEWPSTLYDRQQEELERAILAAAQDAQAETRAIGRSMYAAYAHACPGQASALLLRLDKDKSLQDKLSHALQNYVPGAHKSVACISQLPSHASSGNSKASSPHGSFALGLSRSGSGISIGAARPKPAVPRLALSSLAGPATNCASPSGASSARSATAAAAADSVQSLPQALPWQQQQQQQQQMSAARENQPENQSEPAAAGRLNKPPTGKWQGEAGLPPPRPHSARGQAAGRRSVGGAALRVSLAAAREEMAREEEGAVSAAAAALGGGCSNGRMPRRVSVNPGALRVMRPLPLPPLSTGAAAAFQGQLADSSRLAACRSPSATLERPASTLGSDASALSSLYEESPAASLSQLLSQAMKAGSSWSDRVGRFQQLEEAVHQGSASAAADISTNAERLVAVLLDGCGDAHFKVATAALQALGAGISGPSSRVFEPHLDRIVPLLFGRVADAKEQIRGLVSDALASLPQHHSADAVVAAMAKALQANKAPRVRCAILDHYSSAALSPNQCGLLTAQGSCMRALLSGALQLATDKNPEVRRAAVRMTATAYKAGDAQAVVAALKSLPKAAAEAVHKSLSAAIETLDLSSLPQQPPAPVAAARAAAVAAPAAMPVPLAATSSASRRWSAEGLPSSRSVAGSCSSLAAGAGSEVTSASAVAHQQLAGAPQQPHAAALTPQPPSPFAWQSQSASPLPAAQVAAAMTVAAPAAGHLRPGAAQQGLAPEAECKVAAGGAEQHQTDASPAVNQEASLPPSDGVMEGQLRRLLGQLQAGPASEVLQGLSRLAHVLPAAAWGAHFNQILAAIFIGLDSGSPLLQEAAAMLVRDLASALQPEVFDPALPTLLPRLLACAAQQAAREVAVAADSALEHLLRRVDVAACLAALAQRLPPEDALLTAELEPAVMLHAVIRNLRRAASQLPAAALAAKLGMLLPGLRAAYRSPLADVRKATVDCLVTLWLAVGAEALQPHLQALSASQHKLLLIYVQRAQAAAAARVC